MPTIKSVRELRDFYQKSLRTVSSKNLLKSIEKLYSVLDEARTKGGSDYYLRQLEDFGKAAIMDDFRKSRQEESATYQNQIAQLKNKWTKDYESSYALHNFRQKQFERRLYAMDDSALTKLALDYINNKISFDDPAQNDLLIAELKDRNIFESKGTEPLATAAQLKNNSEPWMNSDDAQILSQKIKMLESPDVGMADETGKTFSAGFNDLYDAFSPMVADPEEAMK